MQGYSGYYQQGQVPHPSQPQAGPSSTSTSTSGPSPNHAAHQPFYADPFTTTFGVYIPQQPAAYKRQPYEGYAASAEASTSHFGSASAYGNPRSTSISSNASLASSMSSASTRASRLSPAPTGTSSYRSSISSSLGTPITPLDMNATTGLQTGESVFGAMQESYLANKGLLSPGSGGRPTLQRMQRMSLSSQQQSSAHMQPQMQMPLYSPPQQEYQQQAVSGSSYPSSGPSHSHGQYLSVNTDTASPPRRASVVTFQPTASRPHPSVLRRPSMQGSSNSDPAVTSRSPTRSRSTLEIPTTPIPGQQQQASTPVPAPTPEQTSEVERLYAEVFGMSQQAQYPVSPSYPLQQQQSENTSQGRMISSAALYSPTSSNHSMQYQYSQPVQMRVGSSQPHSQQQTPTQAQVSAFEENYNFSGVLLQPEDLHMLGPDPLSPTTEAAPAPLQTSYPLPQTPGWQTSFSLAVPPAGRPHLHSQSQTQPQPQPLQLLSPTRLLPALPVSGQASHWNFASFHGFNPIVTPISEMDDPLAHGASLERPASCPPADEAAPVQSYSIAAYPEEMDRRRGSSVDSATMLPFGPAALEHQQKQQQQQQLSASQPQAGPHRLSLSSAYLGPGPGRIASSNLALRRSTVGPGALKLASPPTRTPTASPGGDPTRSASAVPMSAPAAAAGPSSPSQNGAPRATTSSPATRRYAGRGGRRGSRGAPLFINFTSKDANKLLSGVAPSGSSKRKREEEEAAAAAARSSELKHGRLDEPDAEMTELPVPV